MGITAILTLFIPRLLAGCLTAIRDGRLPRPGEIAAFNRSYYVDVLIARVFLAYGAAFRRCSSVGAPWFVVPANRKWLGTGAHRHHGGHEVTYRNPHVDVRASKKTLQAVA